MAIEWLKRKHRVRKPTQDGYRRPADSGDQGTKHLHKHKLSAGKGGYVSPPQVPMVMVLDKDFHIHMRRA